MDGVNDNTAFVNCVAATPAGGSLFVPGGTAAINAVTLTKEVHIHGEGNLQQISANSDFITFGVGSDGSTIEDISVDGNQTPGVQFGNTLVLTVANIAVKNNVISNGEHGLRLTSATCIGASIAHNRFHTNRILNIIGDTSASQIKILNNKLEDCEEGIRLTACTDATITGNTVLDFIGGGIRIFEETTGHTVSAEIIIANNYVSNFGKVAASAKGIDIYSSNYVSILNNVIDKVTSVGIQCDWASVTSAIPLGVTILGNTVIEPVKYGIRIPRLNRGIVTNNNIVSNNVTERGMAFITTIDDTLITNNNVGQCTIAEIETTATETNVLYQNNIEYNVLHAGATNLAAVNGLSTSTTRANNVFGIASWPGGVNNSNAVVFGTAETDANYELIMVMRNSAVLDGIPIYVTTRLSTGFTLRASGFLPPAGTEVGWVLVRVTTPHT